MTISKIFRECYDFYEKHKNSPAEIIVDDIKGSYTQEQLTEPMVIMLWAILDIIEQKEGVSIPKPIPTGLKATNGINIYYGDKFVASNDRGSVTFEVVPCLGGSNLRIVQSDGLIRNDFIDHHKCRHTDYDMESQDIYNRLQLGGYEIRRLA